MIPYSRQFVDEDDIASVVSVLRGDWLTQGPAVERFEAQFAEYVEVEHAVSFSSASAALHASVWASGMGPGSVGATPALTFVATANSLRHEGVGIKLVDIERTTFNIDWKGLPEVDIVIPVHFAGLPAIIPGKTISSSTVVVEDASHALGASTPSGPVGNCRNSAITCFSFHPVKPITTGEGGMATTNDGFLAERLRRFRSHGIVRKPDYRGWYYEAADVGYNYRMSDLQAALGSSQLVKIESFVRRRDELADFYRQSLDSLPLDLPPQPPAGYRHAYHLFPILVDKRRELYDWLHSNSVRVQVHYIPLHHHPVNSDLVREQLSVVDQVYERILSIPMFPSMSDEHAEFVVDRLTEAARTGVM